MTTSAEIFDDIIKPYTEELLTPREIRLWRRSDTEQLKPLYRAFLEHSVTTGGDMVPDDHNVDTLIEMGMRFAEQGQACLVATVPPTENGQPREIVAFVTWAEIPNPLHLRERVITAYGTYTKPEHRSRGLAFDLRKRCAAICIANGVRRVQGPIHVANPRGVEVFKKDWNAEIVTYTMEGYV